jgi:hypothetical protein
MPAPRSPRVPRLLLFGLAAWMVAAAQAQISVSIKMDRKHYLRYEPIEITVQLRNTSGNTLVFGDEEGANRGYLRFTIERPEGQEIRPTDQSMNPVADLILGAGESRQIALNLNQFFDLRAEGSYVVTAQVGHKRLPSDYRSEPVSIDVREGVPVITRNLGLPQADGGADIKAITASLLLFHDGDGWLYCLRAETDAAVLGTVRLGAQISGSQPQMDADAASDIHVLVQVQSRLCLYAVYGLSDAGLQLRQRRYYKPDEYGPRLSQAPGYLKVVGGSVAQEGVDVQTPPTGAAPNGAVPAPAAGSPERADKAPAAREPAPPAATPDPPADRGG